MYSPGSAAPAERNNAYDPREPYAPQPQPTPYAPPYAQQQPQAPNPAAEIPPLGALGTTMTHSPEAAAYQPAQGVVLGAGAPSAYPPASPDPAPAGSVGYPPATPPQATAPYASAAGTPQYPQAVQPPAAYPAEQGYPQASAAPPAAQAPGYDGASYAQTAPYPTAATPDYTQTPGVPVVPAPDYAAQGAPRQPDYEALVYETPAHARQAAAAERDPYHANVAARMASMADMAEPVQPLRTAPRGFYAWNGIRAVHYILGVVEVLLAIRFFMMLFAADSSAPFAKLVFGITTPLVLPFGGVFGSGGAGAHIFDATAILAGIIYALIAWGITSLMRLEARRRHPLAPVDPLIPPQEPPPTPPTYVDDSVLP